RARGEGGRGRDGAGNAPRPHQGPARSHALPAPTRPAAEAHHVGGRPGGIPLRLRSQSGTRAALTGDGFRATRRFDGLHARVTATRPRLLAGPSALGWRGSPETGARRAPARRRGPPRHHPGGIAAAPAARLAGFLGGRGNAWPSAPTRSGPGWGE